MSKSVTIESNGSVRTVILHRPERRNAVDRECAQALAEAFRSLEDDSDARAIVLWGRGGHFCAGADLKAFSEGRGNRLSEEGDGPMGPTRMLLSKPVIAAVEGYAVAGGLELALWCDLRVASEDARFGVFCRRFGVPLIDGGTSRLPRAIGMSRAMDLILTGRAVDAAEALHMGLANRVVAAGSARAEAEALAQTLADFPQRALSCDRQSAYKQWGQDSDTALRAEFAVGKSALDEAKLGSEAFARGKGRHGRFK